MKLSTTNINEDRYEILGLVHGMQVKTLNIGRNFMTGIASVVGTGKNDWTGIKKIFDNTKKEAFEEMEANARALNATEILGVKTEISQISHGDSDGMLVASVVGTAVRKRDKSGMQKGGKTKTHGRRRHNKNKNKKTRKKH